LIGFFYEIDKFFLFAQGKAGKDVCKAVSIRGNEVNGAAVDLRVLAIQILPPNLGSLAVIIERAAQQL